MLDEIKWEESGSRFWELNTIGESIEGIFVEKQTRKDKFSGQDQEVYILAKDNGDTVLVSGRMSVKSSSGAMKKILSGMSNVSLGERVKMTYTEDKKNDKGFAAKIIKVMRSADRKIHGEVLDKYRNAGPMEEVPSEEVLPPPPSIPPFNA